MSQVSEINAILDGLGEGASFDQVEYALRDYEQNMVLTVVADRSLAAGGGGGGSRPFLEDTDTGIVVNRAGGFVSEWEVFDVEQPGVGYGKMTITAADGDGLVWATDLNPAMEIAVSADGTTWVNAYGGSPAGTMAVPLDVSAASAPDPVGDSLSYMSMTPRYIRFRALISDALTGELYAGADDPTFTFTLYYTAG